MNTPLTRGEELVRVHDNPWHNHFVDIVKRKVADLIDDVGTRLIEEQATEERRELVALAERQLVEACETVVRAATV